VVLAAAALVVVSAATDVDAHMREAAAGRRGVVLAAAGRRGVVLAAERAACFLRRRGRRGRRG
jgi:hypothetical protein